MEKDTTKPLSKVIRIDEGEIRGDRDKWSEVRLKRR